MPSAMTLPLWYFSWYVAIMYFVVVSSPLFDGSNWDDDDDGVDDISEGLLLSPLLYPFLTLVTIEDKDLVADGNAFEDTDANGPTVMAAPAVSLFDNLIGVSMV